MNLVKSSSLIPLKCFVFLICFLAFGLTDVKGQFECITLDLFWLNSQTELDSWGVGNEDCTYFGWVIVGSNSSTVSDVTDLSPLNNITRFNYGLSISQNPVLTTLIGLENLESSGYISISDNDVLPNLSGLENLTSISSNFTNNNRLSIAENTILNDISAITNANLEDVIELTIRDNPQLSFCSYPNICDYILSGGVVNIANNAPGCNSLSEVLNICGLTCIAQPIISVNDQPILNGLYHAVEEINSTGIVPNGGMVNFKAGQVILLDNGFVTDVNADFSAEVEDCN